MKRKLILLLGVMYLSMLGCNTNYLFVTRQILSAGVGDYEIAADLMGLTGTITTDPGTSGNPVLTASFTTGGTDRVKLPKQSYPIYLRSFCINGDLTAAPEGTKVYYSMLTGGKAVKHLDLTGEWNPSQPCKNVSDPYGISEITGEGALLSVDIHLPEEVCKPDEDTGENDSPPIASAMVGVPSGGLNTYGWSLKALSCAATAKTLKVPDELIRALCTKFDGCQHTVKEACNLILAACGGMSDPNLKYCMQLHTKLRFCWH